MEFFVGFLIFIVVVALIFCGLWAMADDADKDCPVLRDIEKHRLESKRKRREEMADIMVMRERERRSMYTNLRSMQREAELRSSYLQCGVLESYYNTLTSEVEYRSKKEKVVSNNQWMVKNKTKGTWHNGNGNINYATRGEALQKAQELAKVNTSDVFLVVGPYDEVKAVIPIEVTEWGRGT